MSLKDELEAVGGADAAPASVADPAANVAPSADPGYPSADLPVAVAAVFKSVADELSVSVKDVEAVFSKYEHDIVGQAHAIYAEIKALVEAKAAV